MNLLPAYTASPLLQRTYAHGSVDTDIPGWTLRCVQTSSGALDGGARELHAHGVQVLEEHYRHVITNHYGVAPPNAIGFAVPVNMQGDGLFDGQCWYRGGTCVWNTNREFNAIAPPTDLLCLVVDRALLVDYIAQTEHIDLEPALLRASMVTGHEAMSAALAHRLGELVTQAFGQQWNATSTAAQQAIRREVLETLAPMIVAELDPQHDHRGRFHHLLYVRRAREFAMSQLDTPLQVMDLCQALGVSRSALQNSFRAVLGITPLAYLRSLRLDGARRSLCNGMAVKEAAEAWGFWHWGRFSQEYRQLFGELPSTTAKRAVRAGLSG